MLVIWMIAFSFLLIGLALLFYWQFVFRKNYLYRRAQSLNVADVHAFDEVWISGVINARVVMKAPFFNRDCVY